MVESLLIQNGLCVTMNRRSQVIHQGGILIEGPYIKDVGTLEEVLNRNPPPDQILDASTHLVMPGLINAHCHSTSSLRRYLGADKTILDWLRTSKCPFQAHITPADAVHASNLGILENIRLGNTTIIDNYYPPKKHPSNVDVFLQTAQKLGIRCWMARGCQDNPTSTAEAFLESPSQIKTEYLRLIRRFHEDPSSLNRIMLAPVNLVNSTPELLSVLRELQTEHHLFLHTHVAEGQSEVQIIQEQYGKSYLEVFHEHDLLNPLFHGAHGVWLNTREITLLHETQGTIIHNPASNMYLSSGVCPVPQLLHANVNVALGTDSQPSNANLDLLSHFNLVALLQKVHSRNPQIISAADVLQMGFQGGAQALHLSNALGRLEPGYLADIILININQPYLQPLHDPIAAIVYGIGGRDVDTVIINGKIIMENQTFVGVDAPILVEKATYAAKDLYQRVHP